MVLGVFFLVLEIELRVQVLVSGLSRQYSDKVDFRSVLIRILGGVT
jgi:hypothetical protein